MRRMFLIAATAAALAGPALAQAPDPAAATAPRIAPIRASKIILVGDSTTQSGSGWGGAFCAQHVISSLTCVNLARGGRSTSSYRVEGSWDIALGEMSTPGYLATYVLIQFGHNDQPGKPGRSTDLATEFPANLTRYIAETRARGAVPVLVTPLTRRQFVAGRLKNDLDLWAETVRRVAAETRTPVIDLNADSAAAVQALGPAMSARFAQALPSPEVGAALLTGTTIAATGSAPAVPTTPGAAPVTPTAQNNAAAEPMGQPNLAFDYTHLGPVGADFFAAMVTRELVLAVPALRRALIL